MRKKTISVLGDRGMLRLRWTHEGKRYSLNLGLEDTRANRGYAKGIGRQIVEDMTCGQFDPTLNRYRPHKIGNTGLSCSELFDKFIQYKHQVYGVSERSIETRYEPIRVALEKWLAVPAHEVGDRHAQNFKAVQQERVTGNTAKARIWLLHSCWEWAKETGILISPNPWKGLAKGIKPTPTQKVKPFTKAEIAAILEGFRIHPQYCHYVNFVHFLFGTGCRFGEAVGLRWEHLGGEFKTVWIGESISRGYLRSTKTNQDRTIVLSSSIQAMVRSRHSRLNPEPNDLMFPAPRGGAINDRNFSRRAWKSVLAKCNVQYRRVYAIRHSAISHALAKGANPIAVAEQSGHDKRVLLDSYTHVIDSKSVFQEFE